MRRTIAALCTAAPFVAAGIAALGARHDLRMVWMALVTTAVARSIGALTSKPPRVSSAAVSVTVGTIAAAVVAMIAGARAPFGIIAVALVLAVFSTAGAWLSVPRTTTRNAGPRSAV